jgi:hypothetical protein
MTKKYQILKNFFDQIHFLNIVSKKIKINRRLYGMATRGYTQRGVSFGHSSIRVAKSTGFSHTFLCERAYMETKPSQKISSSPSASSNP